MATTRTNKRQSTVSAPVGLSVSQFVVADTYGKSKTTPKGKSLAGKPMQSGKGKPMAMASVRLTVGKDHPFLPEGMVLAGNAFCVPPKYAAGE